MNTYAVIYQLTTESTRKCREFKSLSAANDWAAQNQHRFDLCYIESPEGLDIDPEYNYI